MQVRLLCAAICNHGLRVLLSAAVLGVLASPLRAGETSSFGPAQIVKRQGVTYLERGAEGSKASKGERRQHPTRLIVSFRRGASPRFASGSKDPRALGKESRLFSVHVPPGQSIDEAVQRYRKDPDVLYAEPDWMVSADTTPSDARWSEQWDMLKVAAPAAWDSQTGCPDVVVAVVDTGIDFSHPDLAPNLWVDPVGGGHGFTCLNSVVSPGGLDDHGHGTHVAGTIGARGNDGIGIAGLNWSVQLLSMKFMDANGQGYVSDAVLVFEKLVELRQTGINVRVSNNSWSFGAYSQALKDAMDLATAAGVLHVCAAGNLMRDIDLDPGYPAAFEGRGILTVAATDASDNPASFTNAGLVGVDLAAPGVSTLSTVPTGSCTHCDASGYKLLSGTSMAAPHVAGVAAALVHANPGLSPAELRDALLDPSSVDLLTTNLIWAESSTHARLNFARALANPLVNAPRLNGFPELSIPAVMTRQAGAPVLLDARPTDPDGDPLVIHWARPNQRMLFGNMTNQVFPPGWYYPPKILASQYSFVAPSLARAVTVPFLALVADRRGGSAMAPTAVTVPVQSNPGQPPSGSIVATPAAGPSGTTVRLSFSGADPEGGSMLWGYMGMFGLCCYPTTQAFDVTLSGPSVYRFSAQAIDSEFNLSPASSVVVRIGGATGEPPVANLVLDRTSGAAPLTVSFDASGSYDPDGQGLTFFTECEAWTHLSTPAGPPTGSCTFDTPGPHSVGVSVWDASNYMGQAIANVMVTGPLPEDTTPPAVSIASPTAGSSVSGTVVLAVAASDDVGIGEIEYYRDGGTLVGISSAAPWSVSWNAAAVVPGSHTLYARAYDQAGNTATSATVAFTVLDTRAPTVNLTEPLPGATVSGTVRIMAYSSDDLATVAVDFYLDGSTFLGTYSAEMQTWPYWINWNTSSVAAGSHTIVAKARDAAGNVGTSTPVSVTIADSVVPVVSMTAPANGASVSGLVALTASASDNGPVTRVEFYLDDTTLLGADTSAPWGITWNSASASVGSHTLSARATDTANNVGVSPARTITVLDGTAPTVSITNPTSGSTVSKNTNVTISATASDNVGVTKVEFYANGSRKCSDTSRPYSCSWRAPKQAGVVTQLQAKAYDARGNIGVSSTVQVTTR